MPNSLLTIIRKPLNTNKRLFGLVTIAILIIGALGASYYYHIESNKQNFREYKLQTLDSYYDIISRRLTNDFQTFYARPLKDSEQSKDTLLRNTIQNVPKNFKNKDKISQDSITKNRIAERELWKVLSSIKKPLNIEQEFDEYIIIFNDEHNNKSKPVKQTSLKGLVNFDLDSLIAANPFNIGLSLPIPEDDPKYQLFARNYNFETVLNTKINVKITIIGLVKAERYHEYTRKLDPWIIALLTTFLLLCLFGLPYFKMIFIAEDERLSSRDVIMSGIAVVVGTPLIVAIFLSLMNYYDDYYNAVPYRLEKLSEKIRHRFEQENDSAVTRLHRLDLAKYDYESPSYGDDIQFFPGPENDPGQFKSFKFISKVDSDGDVFYHINLIKSPPKENAPTTLNNRIYFKDYKASENVWRNTDGIEYVMRPVVSIEDQTEEAVYILPDKNNTSYLKIGSVQLKSIHDPILPFGYQFAVVDEQGEVWFHSDDGRSTLENFYAVSRQYNDLKGAITGRVNARGLVKYRDESKLFNVAPIKGTNLSIISLYDLGLLRVRISEALSLAGIAILLAFILLGLVTTLSLLIRNPQLGLFKYRAFLFEFLTPKKSKRDTYILLSVVFTALLILAIIASTFARFLPSSAFVLGFLCITWTYLIVYYSLHPNRNKKALKFRIRDVLLLFLILVLNRLLIQEGSEKAGFYIAVVLVQLLFVFFIIRVQVLSIPEGIRRICRFNALRIRIAYRYWYSIFLFSWLLLSSIFPTYVFFEKSKAINDVIWIKADQIQSVMAYVDKEEQLRNKLKVIEGQEQKFLNLYDEHLRFGQYLDSVYSLVKYEIKTDTAPKGTTGKNVFRELLWSSRPIYDEKVRRFQAMVYQNSWDSTWRSTEQFYSLKFHLNYSKEKGKGVLSTYKTKKQNNYEDYLDLKGLKWIGLIVILAMLFSLILFFVDRFFAFRFRHLKANDFDTNSDQDYMEKFANVLRSEDSNSGLLLIGLPFSGKGNFAKDIISVAGYKHPTRLSFLKLDNLTKDADIPQIFDALNIDSLNTGKSHLNWKNKDAFVIENLEHNLKSFNANRIKLRLISFLISEKKRVILTSEVYPSQILALYDSQDKKGESSELELACDFNSWRNILSAFPQVLIGITDGRKRVAEEFEKEAADKNSIVDTRAENLNVLSKELGHSKFLPTLAPIIHSKNLYFEEDDEMKQPKLDEQRMVMHTQNLSHGYYTDIWNSLPTRERYMLYDLAKDGFLNIKNGNSLFSLMKKGLVVWRDRPVIFNHSFKNFIISSVSMNEALRLEYKNRGEGSWGTVRIIFYLIILTIIIFILLGEPGILKDFETLIGAIGGIGVIIPIISSLLARGGQKQ